MINSLIINYLYDNYFTKGLAENVYTGIKLGILGNHLK
jgi:hypothetical protein